MDRRTIAAVEDLPGVPDYLKELCPDAVTLLVELRAHDKEDLKRQVQTVTQSLEGIPMTAPIHFYFEENECKRLWEIRDGFDPIISAKGAPGTIMISEDVAIPIEHMGEAIGDFRRLFDQCAYEDAIIFGHALAGNFHFDILQDFNSPQEVLRFKKFIEGMVDIVVNKYNGSLKAEHGTGRNMAPFVEKEWGGSRFRLDERN